MRPRAWRPAALVLVLAGLAAPAAAGAYDPGFDPSALSQVACGRSPEWCGTWATAAPGGSAGIVPLGPVTLQGVDAGQAAAAAGRPFGSFSFSAPCDATDAWYRGTYTGANGVPGQVLACDDSSRLVGQYRDDPQPGLPFRSGTFSVTYQRESPARFSGEIVEHLRGSGPWAATCGAGRCLPPVQGPAPLPPPGPSLEDLLRSGNTGVCLASPISGTRVELGRTLPGGAGCRLSPGARDVVQAVGEVSFSASVVTCLSAAGGTGASAFFPGALPPTIFLLKLCWASAIGMVASEVTLYRDPPDPAFRLAGLARPRPEAPGRLATLCRAGRTGPACTRPVPAARRYLAAAGAVASLQEAIAVAVNRLATARTANDAPGQALQLALVKVYAGPLADAVAEQTAAGRQLARELRRSGIGLRLRAGAADRGRRALLGLRAIPAPVLARLGDIGLGRADIVAGLRADPALARPAGALDLAAVLARATPTAGLRAFHRSLTAGELMLLTRALRIQGAVPASVATALEDDLRAAPGAQGARRYLRRVQARLPGRFGELLEVAAGALVR